MNKRHRTTLQAIFADPVRSNIPWRAVESLFGALEAHISEGSGSRIRVELNGEEAVFHRPHPQKEMDRGAVKSVRRFMIQAGIRP